MLAEFEQIEQAFGADKAADLRKALHYLLRHQFVFAGDRGTAIAYNTVMDGRFRAAVDAFFDTCGYRLHRDPEAQWAGIIAIDEDVPLPRLRLDEMIVILVLAAHWQDEVNVGAVEERATVVTTLNALYDRYRDLVHANGRTAITTSRFLDILKEAGQRGLVQIGDYDSNERDYEVVIRPMIKLVSGGDVLARIERFLRQEEARGSADARGQTNR
ncbi:MAG TPA: DUF4194 domain-containing protein [Xanthobacteraceae bacterium]|nr:DUF4194 domain-containing protein [Xanthobacteraceae bacterium]